MEAHGGPGTVDTYPVIDNAAGPAIAQLVISASAAGSSNPWYLDAGEPPQRRVAGAPWPVACDGTCLVRWNGFAQLESGALIQIRNVTTRLPGQPELVVSGARMPYTVEIDPRFVDWTDVLFLTVVAWQRARDGTPRAAGIFLFLPPAAASQFYCFDYDPATTPAYHYVATYFHLAAPPAHAGSPPGGSISQLLVLPAAPAPPDDERARPGDEGAPSGDSRALPGETRALPDSTSRADDLMAIQVAPAIVNLAADPGRLIARAFVFVSQTGADGATSSHGWVLDMGSPPRPWLAGMPWALEVVSPDGALATWNAILQRVDGALVGVFGVVIQLSDYALFVVAPGLVPFSVGIDPAAVDWGATAFVLVDIWVERGGTAGTIQTFVFGAGSPTQYYLFYYDPDAQPSYAYRATYYQHDGTAERVDSPPGGAHRDRLRLPARAMPALV